MMSPAGSPVVTVLPSSKWRRARGAGLFIVCLGLMAFYVTAAAEHGRRVNVSKARGDQSGYLWDAQNVYANWHGRRPPMVIGERNRMPVYAAYLALLYRPGMSDPDFFEIAKRANIYLSLLLLVLLGVIFIRELPVVIAVNLTGIVAFGFFIFKAGYAQSELLFYFFMFVTFLGCWHLFSWPPGWHAALLAGVTGALAGLAHLTKAAMLPFVLIFVAVYGAPALASLLLIHVRSDKQKPVRGPAWRAAVALLLCIAFIAVLWPYLSTSKRVFGQYFYNVNSTFYVWYDNWPQASVGTYVHGDGVGWPTTPESELPGPVRYWREHTLHQMAARVFSGLKDIGFQSYQMFGYFKYLSLYGAMFGLIVATHRPLLGEMVRAHRPLAAFLAVYGLVYLFAIAFYSPTSGTGTGRFILAHAMPLFFVLSRIFASPRLDGLQWRLAGSVMALAHFHVLVAVTLALDVAFGVWPRLMTTYGGF